MFTKKCTVVSGINVNKLCFASCIYSSLKLQYTLLYTNIHSNFKNKKNKVTFFYKMKPLCRLKRPFHLYIFTKSGIFPRIFYSVQISCKIHIIPKLFNVRILFAFEDVGRKKFSDSVKK